MATVHHRSNRLGFWDPGVVLSTVVCLDVTRVSSSHGDLVTGGNGLSGSAETMDTARNRAKRRRGNEEELTLSLQGWSVGSGRLRGERGVAGDPGGRSLKAMKKAMMQCVRRSLALRR